MKHWRAALITLLLFAPACELFDDDADFVFGPMPFVTVEVFGIAVLTASSEVFRDADAWSEFYCLHTITNGPTCEPPSFDFERSMLIGVFWGSGFSGCTDRTESVTRVERTRLAIEVTVVTPADLGDCEALVAPRQIIRVDRSSLPVVVLGLDPA